MTSKEVVNRLADGGRAWAMVLVEQTWVFWLEDNLEDLEVGASCCEKVEVLLDRVGGLHLGLVLYWRYMCELRLLQAQIQRSLEAVPSWRRGGRELRGQEILEMWMMLCQSLLDWSLWWRRSWLERVLELWEGMEEGRSNQATGMGVGPVGVALVTAVLRAGMQEEVDRRGVFQ